MQPEWSQKEKKDPPYTDSRLFDALSSFNREKTLERVVHAKGAGAHGVFEITHDISDICDIDMLLGVGKKTACTARFSTTTFERGSADAIRDPKGMAVKFFTEQGNWDWVCLNIPFFFIRDPMKFPGMMHAQRRDPQTNLVDPNLWWDWVCNNHEALHMVVFQYSDFGDMFNYRGMSGYVGHAFKWVKRDGSWKYVHFFFTSDQGPDFTSGQKVDATVGDMDSATRDLSNAIERGEYPSWTAHVQVVDPKDAPELAFNILDSTKHWNLASYPQDIPVIPPRPFGKLTLTQNPKSFFTEIEQLAFSPSNLVPGVEPSEDPILQARLFAYPDAQRYRLGANLQQLSDNQPSPSAADAKTTPTTELDTWLAQTSSQAWSQPNELDYKYPRDFWNVLPKLRSAEFQNSIVVNMSKSLAQTRAELRERVYQTLRLVAADLADRVRDATEMLVPDNMAASSGMVPRSSRL
ncbi:catalase Cat [Penicillium cataractarum]|uniref:Catalase Cat n=1 Tax=Penicillium cataractarum TaxID=2100454 RepID=A0A9X0B5Y7_9EURO|nr:catalase Cat [Penicillium cataractarum]KAJ5389345.1 catalase Cat [Penicillium cataractarum]